MGPASRARATTGIQREGPRLGQQKPSSLPRAEQRRLRWPVTEPVRRTVGGGAGAGAGVVAAQARCMRACRWPRLMVRPLCCQKTRSVRLRATPGRPPRRSERRRPNLLPSDGLQGEGEGGGGAEGGTLVGARLVVRSGEGAEGIRPRRRPGRKVTTRWTPRPTRPPHGEAGESVWDVTPPCDGRASPSSAAAGCDMKIRRLTATSPLSIAPPPPPSSRESLPGLKPGPAPLLRGGGK